MTRRRLTPREWQALLDAQGGVCFTPGCNGAPAIGEHWTPVAMGNSSKPDALLCKDCARAKTRTDVKNIAKVKRIAEGRTQYDRRKRLGPSMVSRGFQKDEP